MPSLKSTVLAAAIAGAATAAASPNIAIDRTAIEPVAQTIAQKVEPLIQHATNGEPWYQSRVTIGNYVTMASALIGPLIGRTFSPEEQALMTALITGAGVVFGAGLSLYGRWVAKKPLGS